MNFKKAYKKANGYTPICKIGECSLKMLEFGIIELEDGESVTYHTEDKETAFILLEGYCTVKFDDVVWEHVGNRNTVFEKRKAVSGYMWCDYQRKDRAAVTAGRTCGIKNFGCAAI